VTCGEETFEFFAGQQIENGSPIVSNDEENLYVTYTTTGNWFMTEFLIYVLGNEPDERLTPGLAPYKSGDISTQSYTFTISFDDLDFATKVIHFRLAWTLMTYMLLTWMYSTATNTTIDHTERPSHGKPRGSHYGLFCFLIFVY